MTDFLYASRICCCDALGDTSSMTSALIKSGPGKQSKSDRAYSSLGANLCLRMLNNIEAMAFG